DRPRADHRCRRVRPWRAAARPVPGRLLGRLPGRDPRSRSGGGTGFAGRGDAAGRLRAEAPDLGAVRIPLQHLGRGSGAAPPDRDRGGDRCPGERDLHRQLLQWQLRYRGDGSLRLSRSQRMAGAEPENGRHQQRRRLQQSGVRRAPGGGARHDGPGGPRRDLPASAADHHRRRPLDQSLHVQHVRGAEHEGSWIRTHAVRRLLLAAQRVAGGV
ncbi:MAG: hypothetical protein AVDCRST_MAG87-3089, partial [uncultured Thermomicrobiales bacterium]